MSYHITHWTRCPFTQSLVSSVELYLGHPISVVGLHHSTWAPIFVVCSPSKEASRRLQDASDDRGRAVAYWGSWKTVNGHRVTGYRLLLKGEPVPGSSTRPIKSRLAQADAQT